MENQARKKSRSEGHHSIFAWYEGLRNETPQTRACPFRDKSTPMIVCRSVGSRTKLLQQKHRSQPQGSRFNAKIANTRFRAGLSWKTCIGLYAPIETRPNWFSNGRVEVPPQCIQAAGPTRQSEGRTWDSGRAEWHSTENCRCKATEETDFKTPADRGCHYAPLNRKLPADGPPVIFG